MKSSDLLSKGFFPRELPPPFHTKEFAKFYDKNRNSLPKPQRNSRGIKFSCPRIGLTRKVVVVTNPAHQAPLFDFIESKWTDIESIYDKSDRSASRPKLKGYRAANLPSYKAFLQKCFKASYFHRVEIKTDISKYFPTIYTHSIPWAIHSKPIAKTNFSNSLWGNKLDELVRNTQYGQTMGIPIGPDSSHIIAELIGTAIDEHLQKKFPKAIGFRYVDNIYYYFSTRSEAEIFMKEVRHIFREYELQVNAEKTQIRDLPIGIDEDWVIRLRKFPVFTHGGKQANDIISYFSLAYELAKQHPNKHVLSFAIRTAQKLRVTKHNFDLYQSLLLKTLQVETETMPDVLRILLSYKSWVDKKMLKQAIYSIIKYSAPRGLDYEVSWALWIAITFKIKIKKEISKTLESVVDSCTILVILDAIDKNLIKKSDLDLKPWKQRITADSLWDEDWIFAYEIAVKKWLLTNFDYIKKMNTSRLCLRRRYLFITLVNN